MKYQFGAYKLTATQKLHYQDRLWEIDACLPENRISLLGVGHASAAVVTVKQIVDDYFAGKVKFEADPAEKLFVERSQLDRCEIAELDPNEQKIFRRKLLYVESVRARAGDKLNISRWLMVIGETAAETDDPCAPSPRTVWGWHQALRASGEDVRVLVRGNFRSGNRLSRLPIAVMDILQTHGKKAYLSTQRPSIRSVFRLVQGAIERQNQLRSPDDRLKTPSYKAVRAYFNRLDRFEVMRARNGKRAADREFRAYQKGPIATRSGERIAVDHTQADLFVIDDASEILLGRPWISIALDEASRYIVGCHIGFDPPCAATVMELMRSGMLPREDVRKTFPSVKNVWDTAGLWEGIICDNGKEFYSESFDQAALSLGIKIQYSPPHEPWFKGKVERFFRTLNTRLIHLQPGTTFGKAYRIADFDPVKHACVEYSKLKEIITMWIVDVYHQDFHEGILTTPSAKWQQLRQKDPMRLPPSADVFDAIVGLVDRRKLQKYGIELEGQFFNCDELSRMRASLPEGDQNVLLKKFPESITYIYVQHPLTREYVRVPNTDQKYAAGKSWYLHGVILREAREAGIAKVRRADILDAEERIKKRIRKHIRKGGSPRGNRQMARLMEHLPGEPGNEAPAPATPLAAADDNAVESAPRFKSSDLPDEAEGWDLR
jgi:putative transposase